MSPFKENVPPTLGMGRPWNPHLSMLMGLGGKWKGCRRRPCFNSQKKKISLKKQ